jgi:hypothetical protein
LSGEQMDPPAAQIGADGAFGENLNGP